MCLWVISLAWSWCILHNTYHISTSTGDQSLKVYWPEPATKLALMLSGGYDSALMLWLWCQIDIPANSELIPVCTDRGFGAVPFASRILDEVNCLTGKNLSLTVLPVSPDLHHKKQVIAPVRKAIKQGMFDFVISADTAVHADLSYQSPDRLHLSKQFSTKNWHLPFLHLDKSHTVQLVHDLNLYWIPRLSHSCTNSHDLRCKQCWQCTERAWAHQVTGIADTGEF
jgi:hypothetical protein